MGLNKENGTLEGVEVTIRNPDTEEWTETTAVGWRLVGGSFFIGIGEREDGYDIEIVVDNETLHRMANS